MDTQNSSQSPPETDPAVAPDLDQTLHEFQTIQADLNYQDARQVLQQFIQRLDLSPRERHGLEDTLHNLESMQQRLDRLVVQIAVFGLVGRGKSSLLNALLGQEVFATGPTHGITQTVERSTWTMTSEAIADQTLVRVSLPGTGQSQIELIDTPGIDEVHGEWRERLAQDIARQADLILFVIAGDMTRVEYEALSLLRQASKPMLLVFNKTDHYPAADRQAIYQTLRDQRVRSLISPDEIVMTAAAPLVTQAVRRTDGSLEMQRYRGQPQVDDLKLKILDVLHREGKSLVALNTMLYTDAVNEQVIARKLQIRDRSADEVIWNAAILKATAVALNPVTVADMVGGALVDVVMILCLSRVYGISMTQAGAVGVLKKIALGMGGITASELLTTLGLSSLKSLLAVAAPATAGISLMSYLPVALAQATVAGVSAYGIGQIAKTYLAQGATWGPDGPKAVIQQVLDSLDEASILHRIRTELEAKLGDRPPSHSHL